MQGEKQGFMKKKKKTMAESMGPYWTLDALLSPVEKFVTKVRKYGTVMERRTPLGTDKIVIRCRDGSRHEINFRKPRSQDKSGL